MGRQTMKKSPPLHRLTGVLGPERADAEMAYKFVKDRFVGGEDPIHDWFVIGFMMGMGMEATRRSER